MRILLLTFLLCVNAHAASVFLGGVDKRAPAKGKIPVEFSPGTKVYLDAGFYDVADGQAPVGVAGPDGTFEWQLHCGDDKAACPGAILTDDGHGGRVLEITPDAPANLSVVVTHHRIDGTSDGNAEFDFAAAHADGSPPAPDRGKLAARDDDSDDTPEPAYTGRHSLSAEGGGRRDRSRDNDSSSSGGGSGRGGSRGFGGGGGGDSDDGGSSSYHSRRSRRSRGDSSDGYYSGGGGGYGSGGGSASTQRGYNRDNEVPVVICKNLPGKDGQNNVVCEDEAHKTLRLKPKAAAKAPAKPKKKLISKKAPPKSAKKPASLHSN